MIKKQTGKDIDFLINQYHTTGKKEIGHLKGTPARDLQAYYDDKRNENVVMESIQAPVKLTRYGVHFKGQVDQIREIENELYLFDVKYSVINPANLVQIYLPQLLIYCEALQVRLGGIINVANYSKDLPVFIYIGVDKPHEYLKTICDLIVIKRG